jgi:hypothetical protein
VLAKSISIKMPLASAVLHSLHALLAPAHAAISLVKTVGRDHCCAIIRITMTFKKERSDGNTGRTETCGFSRPISACELGGNHNPTHHESRDLNGPCNQSLELIQLDCLGSHSRFFGYNGCLDCWACLWKTHHFFFLITVIS